MRSRKAMNYRKTFVIVSIVLVLFGLLRSADMLMSMTNWLPAVLENGMSGILLGLVDVMTSFGVLAIGIIGMCLHKKETGLIGWSILSFLVCIMMFVGMGVTLAGSGGQYSSSREAMVRLVALPGIQGICAIGIEKRWEEKYQQ